MILFLCILQRSEADWPSISRPIASDLALLDIASGYFSRLEFFTGSNTLSSFAKDLIALTRSVAQEEVSVPAAEQTIQPTEAYRQSSPLLNRNSVITDPQKMGELDFMESSVSIHGNVLVLNDLVKLTSYATLRLMMR